MPTTDASTKAAPNCRGLFLYLHQITTARIVTRMVTDIQKAAFAHLIEWRLCRDLVAKLRDTWVSRLTTI